MQSQHLITVRLGLFIVEYYTIKKYNLSMAWISQEPDEVGSVPRIDEKGNFIGLSDKRFLRRRS